MARHKVTVSPSIKGRCLQETGADDWFRTRGQTGSDCAATFSSLLNMIEAIWVWSLLLPFVINQGKKNKKARWIYVNTGKPPGLRGRILRTCLQHKQMSPSDIWHGFPRCQQLSTQLARQRVHVTAEYCIRRRNPSLLKRTGWRGEVPVNIGWEICLISV